MSSFEQPPVRGATTLGEYAPNHFLLRFRRSAPFLVVGAEGVATHDDRWVSVFWHEYIHYWHNVSTLVGIKSLEQTQHVLACVSRGIASTDQGLSAPTIELAPADEAHLRGLAALFAHVEGDA